MLRVKFVFCKLDFPTLTTNIDRFIFTKTEEVAL